MDSISDIRLGLLNINEEEEEEEEVVSDSEDASDDNKRSDVKRLSSSLDSIQDIIVGGRKKSNRNSKKSVTGSNDKSDDGKKIVTSVSLDSPGTKRKRDELEKLLNKKIPSLESMGKKNKSKKSSSHSHSRSHSHSPKLNISSEDLNVESLNNLLSPNRDKDGNIIRKKEDGKGSNNSNKGSKKSRKSDEIKKNVSSEMVMDIFLHRTELDRHKKEIKESIAKIGSDFVNGLCEALCGDYEIIAGEWARYPIDRDLGPMNNIKQLFYTVLSKPFEFGIDGSYIELFSDMPTLKISIDLLSSKMKRLIVEMEHKYTMFFSKLIYRNMTTTYLHGFCYNGIVNDSELRMRILSSIIFSSIEYEEEEERENGQDIGLDNFINFESNGEDGPSVNSTKILRKCITQRSSYVLESALTSAIDRSIHEDVLSKVTNSVWSPMARNRHLKGASSIVRNLIALLQTANRSSNLFTEAEKLDLRRNVNSINYDNINGSNTNTNSNSNTNETSHSVVIEEYVDNSNNSRDSLYEMKNNNNRKDVNSLRPIVQEEEDSRLL